MADDHNLRDLLASVGVRAPYIMLKEIALDSRKVVPGALFLAIKGYQTDGRQYISQAISQGVAAIIAESQGEVENGTIQYVYGGGIPIVYINDLNKQLSLLAAEFYQYPATKLRLIGVTGTNGKTTVTQLIAQWAKCQNEISAVMGTLGNGILGEIISNKNKNTTDSAVDIQAELQRLLSKQVTLVAMEVSSHGLAQNRVAAISFTATVFTNLSHDHLDYHTNMQNYAATKWLLFSSHKSDKQIINVDDDTGLQWLKRLPQACAVSIKKRIPTNWQGYWMLVERIKYHDYRGVTIHFNSTWGAGSLESPLIGFFNVSNVMLAMATLLMIGYPLTALIKSSNVLQPICGRMEVFTTPGCPTVVIDYAHTPDALEKVLNTLRFYCRGKLYCVFGCGGNRDKAKRALMGGIAEQYADVVIITSDNPRTEDQESIINDILSGFLDSTRAISILRREEAVTSAIMQANVDDVILIAGKGHEDYQIIGDRQLNYSDRSIVAELLGVII